MLVLTSLTVMVMSQSKPICATVPSHLLAATCLRGHQDTPLFQAIHVSPTQCQNYTITALKTCRKHRKHKVHMCGKKGY